MFKMILIILSQTGFLSFSNVETNGKFFHKSIIKENRTILPDNFNPEKAKKELLKARKTGNKELFSRLSSYLHEWWERNRKISTFSVSTENKTISSFSSSEENLNIFSESTKWGNDVRMDSRDNIYDVKITSLSNGELYAIAILEDSIKVILMSKDNGETWKIKYEYNFGSDYRLLSPGIITVNDTLVEWYVIHNISANTYYGWVKVTLPDSGDFPIYWGSPTGTNGFYIYSLHLTSDAPVYGPMKNLYATWIEKDFGESWSRIMFSRSDELDVSNWEIGPTNLYSTSGVGPYWLMTRIAYGQPDKLWIVVTLHSWGYFPNAILGCFSNDFGVTWSNNNWLRESGETYADISASYKDSNWVIIFGRGPDRLTTTDLYLLYSTDGGLNWTENIWDTSGTQNFLADVFVDDSSTSFFGVYRKNYDIYKELIVKVGDINNPASWTAGDVVNEDNTRNLSDIHIPSIGFNYFTQEPLVAWTDFSNNIYSIWFDALSRVRISEDRKNINKNLSVFITGKNSAKILFTLTSFSMVKLNLFSTSGRKVKEIFEGGLTQGTHSFRIRIPVSGKYFLKIKTEKGEDTESIILIK